MGAYREQSRNQSYFRPCAFPDLAAALRLSVRRASDPVVRGPGGAGRLERPASKKAGPVKNISRSTAGSMRRLKAAFSNSIETTEVDSQIGQDGEIFPSSTS